MAKVLLLEDDVNLAESLIDLLEDEGFKIKWVRDGMEAIESTFNQSYDIMLLDINVPKLDGFKTLNELRNSLDSTPAIFISAQQDIASIAKGFEVGANDYIKKPFDFDELVIRMQALIRQSYKSHKNQIELDEFLFDIEKEELYKNGEFVSLSFYEQKLAKMFFRNINATLKKDDILSDFAQGDEASEGALRVRINKLRKIGLPIVTIKSIGYRLDKR